MNRSLLIPIACAIAWLPAFPQPPVAPASAPEFEASSVRLVSPHSLEDVRRGIGLSSLSPFPTNLFTARFMPLSVIISIAYGIDGTRISGGPEWLNDQLYDITGKVEGDAILTHDQMKPLLQNLLQQRFHLAAHRESKLVSGYALVPAKGGTKLNASKQGQRQYSYILPNGVQGNATSMATLASILERPAGRPVIDNSGILGLYDFKVRYAAANDPDSNLPDFFTALQEQLGLTLVPQRVPVDLLVIDHVDKIPTEN